MWLPTRSASCLTSGAPLSSSIAEIVLGRGERGVECGEIVDRVAERRSMVGQRGGQSPSVDRQPVERGSAVGEDRRELVTRDRELAQRVGATLEAGGQARGRSCPRRLAAARRAPRSLSGVTRRTRAARWCGRAGSWSPSFRTPGSGVFGGKKSTYCSPMADLRAMFAVAPTRNLAAAVNSHDPHAARTRLTLAYVANRHPDVADLGVGQHAERVVEVGA